jgi:hypothetical protein
VCTSIDSSPVRAALACAVAKARLHNEDPVACKKPLSINQTTPPVTPLAPPEPPAPGPHWNQHVLRSHADFAIGDISCFFHLEQFRSLEGDGVPTGIRRADIEATPLATAGPLSNLDTRFDTPSLDLFCCESGGVSKFRDGVGEAGMSVTEQAGEALLTSRPWELLNRSRGWWDNLARAGCTPAPLALPGERQYRVADVLAWLKALPTRERPDLATEMAIDALACQKEVRS